VTHAQTLAREFAGRQVLITGGAGFTGIWLSAMLEQLGAQVATLGLALTRQVRPTGAGSLMLTGGLGSREIDCDIRDLGALQGHLTDVAPEIVLHLAAQPLVLDSFERPYETISSNATGTLNVLEAACAVDSVQTILIVTSDKVYRNDDGGRAMQETDALGGSDPYSSSKVAAEAIALGYAQALQRSGPRIAIARAGNIIGGGDWSADRLVPDFVRSVAAKKRLLLRNPGATRPWQHVLDAAAGYLMFTAALRDTNSAFAGQLCPALNLGPPVEDCIAVSAVLAILNELSGSDAPQSVPGMDTVGQGREKRLLQLNTDLAETALGWQPRLRIKEALGLCWDVYGALVEGRDAQAVQQEQIRSYLALLGAR